MTLFFIAFLFCKSTFLPSGMHKRFCVGHVRGVLMIVVASKLMTAIMSPFIDLYNFLDGLALIKACGGKALDDAVVINNQTGILL
jgi:hypothetical protein